MLTSASCCALPRWWVQVAATIVALLIATLPVPSDAEDDAGGAATLYLDRFNYKETVDRGDGFFDYGPSDWNEIQCDERTRESLEGCAGYGYKWHEGREWGLEKNYCRHCVPGTEDSCGRDHQSPIDLLRQFGLEVGTHPNATECIDLHWMKYEDSTCSLNDLVNAKQFSIERHGLRIGQPISVFEDWAEDTDGELDGVKLECRLEGVGSRFGRIDFSKGFSTWWHLSHTDLHVPSEHTQEGKRYDAEIQLYHFYSIPYENEMAAVSIFLEAYEDAAPYRYLDKVICEWRRAEYENRLACGLDPVESSYPGCFPLTRGRGRNLREEVGTSAGFGDATFPAGEEKAKERAERLAKKKKTFRTVADVIYYNDAIRRDPGNNKVVGIEMDDSNYAPAEERDWDAWIAEQSQKMKQDEELYHRLKKTEFGGKHTEDLHEKYRRLIQEDELEWFNYWPMLGVRTEYYYRYQGSQTIPPCYGNVVTGSKEGTNHWRVMKDPVRIHPRQLEELTRLIAERIAPPDDPVNACKPDTAADVSEEDGKVTVNTARPLMYLQEAHFKTFCECKDWASKWPEDRAWCKQQDIYQRFYTNPYNFEGEGF
jgi:Eukaryotic-type carbonic anhydrase